MRIFSYELTKPRYPTAATPCLMTPWQSRPSGTPTKAIFTPSWITCTTNWSLARELLADTGSCFLQIGYENVHELACLMNEVFGKENHLSTIPYFTGTNQSVNFLPQIGNWILWFAKDRTQAKYHQLYQQLSREEKLIHMSSYAMCELPDGTCRNLTNEEKRDLGVLPEGTKAVHNNEDHIQWNQHNGKIKPVYMAGNTYLCPPGQHWRVSHEGLQKLADANRLISTNDETLRWKKYEDEIPGRYINAAWTDIGSPQDKRYVVQSLTRPSNAAS